MRWSHLATRFFILALIVLAIVIGKDPLLRYAIIQSSQSMTGARVEIGKVHSSLREGKIYLSNVAIVDPRSTMQNLLQAESAYLQLNPQHLLRREWVIEHGATSQLVFGAPRTTSGAIGDTEHTNSNISDVENTFTEHSSVGHQEWLDQFPIQNSTTSIGNFETVSVAQEIQKRWPDKIKTQQTVVLQLQKELTELNRLIQIKDPNPLRDQKRIDAATAELFKLNERSEQLRSRLHQLRADAEADRDQLFAAKQRDQQRMEKATRVNQFNPELVSQSLLSNSQRQHADEVIRWFKWFRNAIPNPEADFKLDAERGVDIRFAGQTQQPELLIKSLDLDGEGRLANQHFNFSGVAHNISTQPSLHDQPITFQLRAQGKNHVVVDCTLDRRTDNWEDALSIHSPDLSMPDQRLGQENQLLVELSPCRVQSDVKVNAIGDQLSGSLVIRHSGFVIQIAELEEVAGGRDLADHVNLDLAQLNEYVIRAEFGGTFSKPEIKFHSDLGIKLAEVMNKVAVSRSSQLLQKQRTELDRILAKHFETIDKQIVTSVSELAAILNSEAAAIAQLQEVLPKSESSPAIR